LKWRLVALGRLKPVAARAIPDTALRNNGRGTGSAVLPPLFSRPFMEVIALAVDEGRVSARRAAALLDLTVDDLADLFSTHGVKSPIEL
jgi:XRE family transcriptional regulator, fatty acid utilization regulator